jgi:hypothetical protein
MYHMHPLELLTFLFTYFACCDMVINQVRHIYIILSTEHDAKMRKTKIELICLKDVMACISIYLLYIIYILYYILYYKLNIKNYILYIIYYILY